MNGEWLLLLPLLLPAVAVVVTGLWLWFSDGPGEAFFARVVAVAFTGATIAAAGTIAMMWWTGTERIVVDLGEWFHIDHYGFAWQLVGDHLSLPFVLLVAALVGLVGAFSRRYLHRETGFARFYFLLALFGAGTELIVLAGSLDLVFIGWEAVGLTSALLIAFFYERRRPTEHGLRAFVTYRFCDVGLLAATVWLHHRNGHAHFVVQGEGWAGLATSTGSFDAILVGLLLLWASMGKSAQFPLGGWLSRAMEGPTPSSAIFYGGISVHLGAYLLLRATPLLEAEPVVAGAVITVGLLTAVHATFVGRVQTDIKSALAYASMTQIGVIFVEIGLGWVQLAVVHVIGHALFRSLQILRSPSLLHEHHHLEQAMAGVLPRTGAHLERWVPSRLQPWLYRRALERGYLDALFVDRVVQPFLRFWTQVDAVDQRWVAWIERDSDRNFRSTSAVVGEREVRA